MQDRAIAAIGELVLEDKKEMSLVDLYIENMFPDKNYQMLLMVFEVKSIDNILKCNYIGIDEEIVGNNSYLKYAYKKGSSRGGDVTLTTKLSSPVDKKFENIEDNQFKKLVGKKNNEQHIFTVVFNCFKENKHEITNTIEEKFKNFSKEQKVTTGISIKILEEGEEKYLRDYNIVKDIIITYGSVSQYKNAKAESKTTNKVCSVLGKEMKDIYGFAGPFSYSSTDKEGFISGFFNQEKNWRNYPISSEVTLQLEMGRRYIIQNLIGSFYGHYYIFLPHPIVKTETENLRKIVDLITRIFREQKSATKEEKAKTEERIQKLVANEENYFSLDMAFIERDLVKNTISISTMIEEILPSRFRKLFIDVPEIINNNILFQNAIKEKKELKDLVFSFKILKDFFGTDFLKVVQILFGLDKLSIEYVFEKIMQKYIENYIAIQSGKGFPENKLVVVKKGMMLLQYLQELNIIDYNKNFKLMETEVKEKN